jgi:hypothetical protein
MVLYKYGYAPLASVALAALSLWAALTTSAQVQTTAHPAAILVELFTSEGCSSCPPADELLRQISGRKIADGQLVIGLSEHVSYWNGLGWKDPYSSEQYTNRQNGYGAHFGLDSVYTPQMVVNGREQFIGSDRGALQAALTAETGRKGIGLHIISAQVTGKDVAFSYSAEGLPVNSSLQLMAAIADDTDRSNVLRGENSGRALTHVSVARVLAPLGALHATEGHTVSLPLPPSFTGNTGVGHHLVLFAQQTGDGAVLGIDAKPI